MAQLYLEFLYKTIFAISYYGMMRVGEVTQSLHVLFAKNIHIATNKDKLSLLRCYRKMRGDYCEDNEQLLFTEMEKK